MFYTILFTDSKGRTAGILVVRTDGESMPHIDRHCHEDREYEQAYLLDPEKGLPEKPFYVRQPGQESEEVGHALDTLFRDHIVW